MSVLQPTSTRMRLGDILLMRGLVAPDGLERALERQREQGGRIGENLIALGLISAEQLMAVLAETPATPMNVAQTGISRGSLLALLLKFMRMESCETILDLSHHMRLPNSIIQELIDEAIGQRLVQVLGSTQQGIVRYIRYALSDHGRAAAGDAMAQSLYLGPAPVSLEQFCAQVRQQSLTNERLPESLLRKGFEGMVVPDDYIRKLLPAVRAGRTILLYGPPGNGKTSIGTRIATLFRNVIFIPFAMEIGGQIIKVFDGRLHKPYTDEAAPALPPSQGVQLETFDLRWVACRRPIGVAGGELTLEMLDLRFDPLTKLYDAPLHVKCLNGLFLIDDFGRQKVNPTELLNRWIVPLENRVDYLTLNTGMSFQIPFDELVIFSTNLKPADLMDPAFLRRIPYKIELFGPNEAEFRQIFRAAAALHPLQLPEPTLDYIVRRLEGAGYERANFQPYFLCAQVAQLCACFDLPPLMTQALADEALENLYVDLKRPRARVD